MKTIISIILILSLASCATSKSHLGRDIPSLRNFKNVYITIETPNTGSLSFQNNSQSIGGSFGAQKYDSQNDATLMGKLIGSSTSSNGNVMEGNEQILLAAKDIEYSLTEMGFVSVNSPEKANAIVLFSIGTVRDNGSGWHAEKAHLRFQEASTGNIIFSAKSEGPYLTSVPLDSLTEKLIAEISKNY